MTSGTPVWRDTAADDVLRALNPGAPGELDRTPDVLVVGGGMVGLATAAMCGRAGLGRVLLIERDGLADAASGRAAALLSPEPHVWMDPPAFVNLARQSLALWRELDAEWDGALGVESCDCLIALPEAIPLDVDLAAAAEVLDEDGARAAEPELGDVKSAIRVPGQGRVHPLVAAGAFAARVTVATGVAMQSMQTEGGRVTSVHTTAGDIEPGAVVFATGLAPDVLGLSIPQEWIKGHLLATEPAPFRLHHQVDALEGLVLQLSGGELVAGGTLDEGDHEPEVRAHVIDGVKKVLDALLPRAAELDVRHAWCCFRPATADRQPVIDRVPGLDNAWVTCGHFRTGILMAPATGQAIAEWVTTSEQPSAVKAFGLDRFTST